MGRFYAAARGYPALIILKGTALQRVNHPSDHDYTPRGAERRPTTNFRFNSFAIASYPAGRLAELMFAMMWAESYPSAEINLETGR
jgi:hypothetical protein